VPEPETASVIDRLKAATQGLLFTSEADYPIEPFVLENVGDGPLTPQKLLQATGHPPDTPVRVLSLTDFFQPVTQEQDWHNAEERATVQRFRQLVETLTQLLSDIQVFKVGHVESDVYVVGKTASGEFAGVKTRVVET
jgi:hypothetical protein